MIIRKGGAEGLPPYVTVLVAPGELDCGQRAYPHSTWIGTIQLDTLRITRWAPCGYKPRGYAKAAQRALESVRDAIRAGTAEILDAEVRP